MPAGSPGMSCAVPTIRAGTYAVCDEPWEIVTQSSRNHIERIRSSVTAKRLMDYKRSSQAENGKEIDFPG